MGSLCEELGEVGDNSSGTLSFTVSGQADQKSGLGNKGSVEPSQLRGSPALASMMHLIATK